MLKRHSDYDQSCMYSAQSALDVAMWLLCRCEAMSGIMRNSSWRCRVSLDRFCSSPGSKHAWLTFTCMMLRMYTYRRLLAYADIPFEALGHHSSCSALNPHTVAAISCSASVQCTAVAGGGVRKSVRPHWSHCTTQLACSVCPN